MKSFGYKKLFIALFGVGVALSGLPTPSVMAQAVVAQSGFRGFQLSAEDLKKIFKDELKPNDSEVVEVARRAGWIPVQVLKRLNYWYDAATDSIYLGQGANRIRVSSVMLTVDPLGNFQGAQVTGNTQTQIIWLPNSQRVGWGPGGLIYVDLTGNGNFVPLTLEMLNDPNVLALLRGAGVIINGNQITAPFNGQNRTIVINPSVTNPGAGAGIYFPGGAGQFPQGGAGQVVFPPANGNGGNSVIWTPGVTGGVDAGIGGWTLNGGSSGLQIVSGHSLVDAVGVAVVGGNARLIHYLKSDLIGHTRGGRDKYIIQKKDIATYSIKGANGSIDYAVIQVNLPGNNHNTRMVARKLGDKYYLINQDEYEFVMSAVAADSSKEAKKFKKAADAISYQRQKGYHSGYGQVREHAMTHPELREQSAGIVSFISFGGGDITGYINSLRQMGYADAQIIQMLNGMPGFSVQGGQLFYTPSAFHGAQAQPMVIWNGSQWQLPSSATFPGSMPVNPIQTGIPGQGVVVAPAAGVDGSGGLVIQRRVENPQIINWGTAQNPKWFLEIPVKGANDLFYRYEHEALQAGEVKDGKLVLSAARLEALKAKYPGVNFASVGIQSGSSTPVTPAPGAGSGSVITPVPGASGSETVVVTWGRDGSREIQIIEAATQFSSGSQVSIEGVYGMINGTQAYARPFAKPFSGSAGDAENLYNDLSTRTGQGVTR